MGRGARGIPGARLGGCRAHLRVFVKPPAQAGHRLIAFDLPSHNDSDAGDLAPGRTTIVECAEAVLAFVRAHGPARGIVAHSLGAKAVALAVAQGTPAERLVFLAPMGDFALYLDLFADRHGFGPRIRTGLHRRLDRQLGVPLFDTDIDQVATSINNPARFWSCTTPTTPTAPTRRARELSAPGLVRTWSPPAGSGVSRTTESCGIAPRFRPASISSAVYPANLSTKSRKRLPSNASEMRPFSVAKLSDSGLLGVAEQEGDGHEARDHSDRAPKHQREDQ